MPNEKETTGADAPNLYGNIFQITRTPWDITLHVLHGIPAPDVKPGTIINLAEKATVVARVTMPLEVGKLLIKALEMITKDEAVRMESAGVTAVGVQNDRRR